MASNRARIKRLLRQVQAVEARAPATPPTPTQVAERVRGVRQALGLEPVERKLKRAPMVYIYLSGQMSPEEAADHNRNAVVGHDYDTDVCIFFKSLDDPPPPFEPEPNMDGPEEIQ